MIAERRGHHFPAAARLFLGLQRMMRRDWFRVVRVWTARSRQRYALSKLDDQMLKDIGVTRKEAERESAKPFWRN